MFSFLLLCLPDIYRQFHPYTSKILKYIGLTFSPVAYISNTLGDTFHTRESMHSCHSTSAHHYKQINSGTLSHNNLISSCNLFPPLSHSTPKSLHHLGFYPSKPLLSKTDHLHFLFVLLSVTLYL